MDLSYHLENFWEYVLERDIEIYNEFSLQHELGIYLRGMLPDYKVQFERNVSFFEDNMSDFDFEVGFVKKEIDIVAYKCKGNTIHSCYAVELKYPRNGQYPESMFSFLKDLQFMEQLKSAGFERTYCITLVDVGSNFYEGRGKIQDDGIYRYFRACNTITGTIRKPTGDKDDDVEIKGEYDIRWINLKNRWMMYQIEADAESM